MTWIIKQTSESVKWSKVVASMAAALRDDESLPFARVRDYAPKGTTKQHLRKTLDKLSGIADSFDVVSVYDDESDESDVALIRVESDTVSDDDDA